MKRSFINALIFCTVASGLTSCLKESNMNIDPDKGPKNMIEFENTGDNVSGSTSTYPRFTSDLGSVKAGQTVKFNLNISYSGADVAPEDITVNLAVDPQVLTAYNSENGTNYVVPPAAIYSLPTSVVIKKGTRMAQTQVSVTNNSSFNFNVNYGLPLKITSASAGTISSNFGKAVFSFSARNIYDGIYTMDATAPMVDVTSASLTGYYPLEMHLITYTGNSIALYDGEGFYTKGYYHPILSGGTSVSAYGSFSPVFYFDANGNITSVSNWYGQESGGNKRSGVIDPSGVNKVTFNPDGSVKSFEVSYIMTQSVAAPMAPRTYFHEKFTYLGAR